MAASTENLLSLGDLISTERKDFIKQKGRSTKTSREIHLQQRWQEVKERERVAQQHNKQLLQQFEEAQATLKDMLARNAAMKTIREALMLKAPLRHLQVEYERYLERNFPQWQQQFQEKTEAAEKKKMEDYLRLYLEKTEQQRMSAEDGPFLSQGASMRPQQNIPPAYSTQEYSDYTRERSSQYPSLQSSWLIHPQSQTARCPVRVPAQTHNPIIFPPSNFPHPHPFIHHPASTGGHRRPQSRQDAAYWGPSEHSYPWPWADGMPHLDTEEPPFESTVSQAGKREVEISRARSSKSDGSGGSIRGRLSPELDIKPVRLPSAHAESGESVRESSENSSRKKRKKKKKRERSQPSSSDNQRCSSQGLSRSSSEIVIAPFAVAQSSATETSTEEEHTRSSRRSKRSFTAGSPRSERAAKAQTRNPSEEGQCAAEESGSSSGNSERENVRNQSPDENPESCRKEQESGSNRVGNGGVFTYETEKEEDSSAGENDDDDEEERREDFGDGEKEKNEDSERNGSDEDENNYYENSAKANTTEEKVETGGEDEDDRGDDEEANKLKNKEAEIRGQGSASSQDEDDDEDGSEGSEGKIENDEEGLNEEEGGESEEEEENRDSDDSVIVSQEKRSRPMQIIPEDAAEDEESNEGSSDEVSDEDDDVEKLLAPQNQPKTEENNGKADGKPKEICHVDIFQVTDARSKMDHPSDSDEFDHFYD